MATTTSSTSAGKDDSPPAPQLTCYFRSHSENGDDASTETTSGKASLCQETGKKSSFLLQPKDEQSPNDTDTKEGINWYSVPKPAHLFVEQDNHATDTKGFFFGGLQLVFDAKNIEIYLTTPEGKESYLMTCKGIPYKMNGKENLSQESESKVEWRRALCVVPGGPRCISSLRIKLIGATSPPDSTTVKVQFLKLTARIVNASAPPSARTPATPQRVKANPQSFSPNMFGPPTMNMNAPSDAEPPLTQKDLGAAMAGLSFMARKTEENMANLIKEQSKEIEDRVEAYMTRMELQMRALKPTLAMQLQLIKENQLIMKEQQQIMESQSSQINKLLSDNQDLQVRVQSLQADISILRSQGPYDSTGEANSISDGVDMDAGMDADVSESRMAASQLSSEQPLNGAEYSSSIDVVATKEDIEAENARLRNVIQNIEGIDGESLFGGCGATANRPSSNALSVGNYYDAETENIRLKNAIRTVSQVYEEPLIQGCGVTSSAKYTETKRIATMEEEAKVAVLKRLKEAEEIDSGCGYLLEGILLGKIDSAMTSRIKPSDIPIDATRSLENIKKKYSEEANVHTPTIEVELMHQEQKQNASSSDLHTIDE